MSNLLKNAKGKMAKATLFTVWGVGGVNDVFEEVSKKQDYTLSMIRLI